MFRNSLTLFVNFHHTPTICPTARLFQTPFLLEKQNLAPSASPSGPSGDTAKHVFQYKFVMDPDVTAAQIIFLYQPLHTITVGVRFPLIKIVYRNI